MASHYASRPGIFDVIAEFRQVQNLKIWHCWKGIILRRAESMQNELQDHKILPLADSFNSAKVQNIIRISGDLYILPQFCIWQNAPENPTYWVLLDRNSISKFLSS